MSSFELYISDVLARVCLNNKKIELLELLKITPTIYDPETFSPRKGIIVNINGQELKMTVNPELAMDDPEEFYKDIEAKIMYSLDKNI
jgi:hypothetical protein